MNLEAFRRSDLLQEKKQVLSLQTGCISCIVEHLDEYSTEHLSLLPTKFRRQLLTCMPPLDILKLEGTSVVSGLDMNEVWHVIAEHYAEADDTRVDATVLPKTFKSLCQNSLAVSNFYKTIKNDWRSLFLIRTLYIMIHTFKHSSKVAHCSDCEYGLLDEDFFAECRCWGLGMDPLYHDLFWRLVALPIRSELAHYYSLPGDCQTSNLIAVKYYQWYGHSPFQPRLLVPNRHAGYLADSSKNIILELSTILLKESHFRPKVMTFNCGFLHHSEFYQHLAESNKSQSLTDSFLADLFSEVECLELYWPSMAEEVYEEDHSLKSEFDLDASLRTITTVLEAIFRNPSPKLTSLCVKTSHFPTLRDCLPSIAPFFSAHHYTEANKNRVLPIDKAYAGLKNVHILAVEMDCLQDISSIILHQSSVESIEVNFMYTALNPDLLLAPIREVFSQRQFKFFMSQGSWHYRNYSFESTFQQFLSNNHDFEISAFVHGQEVIIPATSSLESVSERKTFLINQMDSSVKLGSIFSWVRNAQVTKPLKFVRSHEGIDSCHQDALKLCISTCEALAWRGNCSYTSILPAFFSETKCPNLQTVTFNEFRLLVLVEILPALFASSPQLKELSLSKLRDTEPVLEDFFECLVSCPNPEQLTVDLRGQVMIQEDVLKLLQVWRKKGQGRKLKAILLKSGLQPMVAEIMSQN